MIHPIKHVIEDFEKCLKEGEPFSIVRPGDGALKLIRVEQKKDYDGGYKKLLQQGIPKDWMPKAIEIIRDACNEANYITSFEPYFTHPEMFPRKFSPGTRKLVMRWETVYRQIGITNTNYFGPNVGFGLFEKENRNILNILKEHGKEVCIINNFKRPQKRLSKVLGVKVHLIQIPGEYGRHYKAYDKTLKAIEEKSKICDVFLVGAGDLGKSYLMNIKRHGKIALDIGNVFTCWNEPKPKSKPAFLKKFITMNKDLTFTFKGRRLI